MRESVVESTFCRDAEDWGVWAVKLAVLGISGFPDRLCMAPGGRVAFVELKRPKGAPRALQGWIHRRLRALGFLVAVIDRPEDVAPFFAAWLGPKP